jgi:hypothetical protein
MDSDVIYLPVADSDLLAAIGDERFRSDDSNSFGPVRHSRFGFLDIMLTVAVKVSLGLLDARLIFILWPLSRFGPIDRAHERILDGPLRRQAAAIVERAEWRKGRVNTPSPPDPVRQ